MQCLQILFYPTAIGSEPQDPSLNSYPHWTRVMCGHAGANLVRTTHSADAQQEGRLHSCMGSTPSGHANDESC